MIVCAATCGGLVATGQKRFLAYLWCVRLSFLEQKATPYESPVRNVVVRKPRPKRRRTKALPETPSYEGPVRNVVVRKPCPKHRRTKAPSETPSYEGYAIRKPRPFAKAGRGSGCVSHRVAVACRRRWTGQFAMADGFCHPTVTELRRWRRE